jgi:hypothetical protein
MKSFTNFLKLIVLFLTLVPAVASAQLNGNYALSGKVNDEHGQPLVGTTVSIKGTDNRTATDSIPVNLPYKQMPNCLLRLCLARLVFKPRNS